MLCPKYNVRLLLGWCDFYLQQRGLNSSGATQLYTTLGVSVGKESACSVGDPGLIPKLRRSPGEGNGNPLQYSCWKIPWTEESGRLQSMESQRITSLNTTQ